MLCLSQEDTKLSKRTKDTKEEEEEEDRYEMKSMGKEIFDLLFSFFLLRALLFPFAFFVSSFHGVPAKSSLTIDGP
jgi:hypothetical protein